MLPSRVYAMVVIVIDASYVVANVLGAVVVVWTTLMFGIYILKNQAAKPCAVLHIKLRTKHHILQTIHEVAMLLLCVPLLTFTIAVVVE